MSNSSTRAYNGSNAASNDNATTGKETVHDHKPSYSLSRFLSDTNQNHPPGYGQAQSTVESEKRMQKLLHSFEAKFSSRSDPPHRSDPASRSDSDPASRGHSSARN
ncbi:hypothetical protein Trisim1_007841 [Trichoderma cf. simile WF8]